MKPIKTGLCIAWVMVLLLPLFLTGCSPAAPGPGEDIVLRPAAVVVNQETGASLISASENQTILTFAENTALLDTMEVGDVIVMGATNVTPFGLLRKVTGIAYGEQDVVVETEFATMEDVIEEGSLSVSSSITMEDFEVAALGVDGIRVLASSEGIGFSVDLSRNFDELYVRGELEFRANPIIRVEATWWRARLDELEFSVETDESLTVEVGTEMSFVDFHRKIPLLPRPITKIVAFQAGPLPVVMTVSFMPVLTVEASVSGHVYVWVGYECQRKAGLHYVRDRDPSWMGIKEQETSFDGGAEAYVQANLQASIGPEVAVKFWDIVGPTGSICGYLEFDARRDSRLSWGLYGGLHAELGVRMEFPIFGWTLGIDPVEVMHYRWLLAQEDRDFTEYTLSISSTGGGSVTTPGEGTFSRAAGTVVSLVANPASGYQFVNWTGNVGTIANVNAPSTTITMNGNYAITANFELIPPTQYNLSISSSSGGSVSTPGEGTFSRAAGTVVSLVANPTSGYQFVNWTGNVGTVANVNSASTTITMNGNYSIKANFELIPTTQYSLTISSTSGGSVTTPGEGTFSRAAGTVVSLVANPASGYQFVNWTGNVGTIANVNAPSTTITMNGNYAITANFELIPPTQYNLSISSSSGGSVSTPGEGTFSRAAGTVVSLVANPTSGYQFVNWTGNVGTVANVNSASTTITMNGNYSIKANFELIPTTQYSLTISSTSGGSVTTPGEGTFSRAAGTVVSLVANPASGYQFVNWTGNVGTVANVNSASTTITMNGDYSIVASFESISTPSRPSGPTSGTVGTTYTYTTGGSTSNLGHSVQYYFNWGDGTNSGWLPVGTTSATKSWSLASTDGWAVMAQARCATHTSVVSGWSSPLVVSISSPTVLTFTSLTPSTITTSTAPYDATLSAVGTNFNNVNRVTFSWTGAASGSATWDRGSSDWSKVTVNSDTSMTLRPRVVETSPTWSGTVAWTVTLRDTTGATASRSFAVTYNPTVTLTLYVHENSASGPIIVGALVTGYDGAGTAFWGVTNSYGYVTISGVPGTWSFIASKSGYWANSWSQSITLTCVKHAYLVKY